MTNGRFLRWARSSTAGLLALCIVGSFCYVAIMLSALDALKELALVAAGFFLRERVEVTAAPGAEHAAGR